MKSREFMDMVRAAGGIFIKTKGDHHCFKLPNGRFFDVPHGRFFDVPHGGRQTEVAVSLVCKLRRLTRQGGGQ